MASLTSKPPSKPVQALNFIAEHTACWFSDESLQTANTVCLFAIIKKTIRPVKGNYYIFILYSPNCSAHSFIIFLIGR